MVEFSHLIGVFVTLALGLLTIYVKQERINATQQEINKNTEKRITKSEANHEDIHKLFVSIKDDIGKIYTRIAEIKNK